MKEELEQVNKQLLDLRNQLPDNWNNDVIKKAIEENTKELKSLHDTLLKLVDIIENQ